MIEQAPLAASEVAAVQARHHPLLMADHAVSGVEPAGLPRRQLRFAHFPMNALILIGAARRPGRSQGCTGVAAALPSAQPCDRAMLWTPRDPPPQTANQS